MNPHTSSSSDTPSPPLQPTLQPTLHTPSHHQFPQPSLLSPHFIADMSPPKHDHPNDSSKKRSLDPIANPPLPNPPPKRPREPAKPKRRLTWYDTIRDAWSILEHQNAGRHQFRMREIVKVVDTHWLHLRGEDKKQRAWRNHLSRAVRKEGMLTRVQSDGPPDLYAMKDPHFKPPPTRPAKKSPGPETETLPEETIYQLSIPTEWTSESFKPVQLSTFDKSTALHFVNADPYTIKGQKGFRMARATAGVMEGDWYFEATVIQLRDPNDSADGAVRLGWSQRRSDVETPVGFDKYGFGLRDRTGEFIHAARLKPYGQRFGIADVIGCRISLPQLTDQQKTCVHDADRAWLTYRFISMLQGPAPQDSAIDIIKDGMVQFYKNGTPMGIPSFFQDGRNAVHSVVTEPVSSEKQNEGRQQRKGKADSKDKAESKDKETATTTSKPTNVPKREMKAGVYYPTVALFGNAIVQANFGPDFRHPIPEGSRPMCEAAREAPPVEEEKEVIEIVDDTPSNPSQEDPMPSPSAPPLEPVPVAATKTERDQEVAEDTTNLESNGGDAPIAVRERQEAGEKQVDKHAVGSRIDASRDIAREGADQPQPEPMAIEA